MDDQDPAPTGHYLSGLVVLPAWRRVGIGDELTHRCLRWVWCPQPSARFFTNARNQASLALHEHLGPKEISRAANYLGVLLDGGGGVLMRADQRSAPTSHYSKPQTAIHIGASKAHYPRQMRAFR